MLIIQINCFWNKIYDCIYKASLEANGLNVYSQTSSPLTLHKAWDI